MSAFFPKRHEGGVNDNPRNPGRELRSGVERANVTISFQKALLHYIFSIILVSEDSGCGIRQPSTMTEPQLPEGRFVTTLGHFYHERFLHSFLP
jgi:hypothetical protein